MPLFPSPADSRPLTANRADYVCYLLILLFTGITYYSNIWDLDFFWQLATGRWIVANAALPHTDPFGVYPAASGDRAQIILKGYWLCQILYYWIYSVLGYAGFALLKALTFTTLFLGQFRFLRLKGTGTAVAALQSLLVYAEFLAFRADRPQIFAYIGVLLVIALIELRQHRWLPLVMIIWANVHGSFLVGVVIIVIYAGAAFIRRTPGPSDGSPALRWYFAGIAAACINPNQLAAFKEMVTMQGGAYLKTVFEYISPINLALKYNDIYWGYFLVLLLGTILIIFLRRRIPPEQMTVFLALALLSLSAARYIPFLVICGSIYTALWVSPLFGRRSNSGMITIAAFGLMAFICIADLKEGRGFTSGIEKGRFPQKAVEFVNSAGATGYMYCDAYWGGYVLWASPGRRISSDSRALSIEQYMNDLAMTGSAAAFTEFSAAGFDAVLTSAFNPITGDRYLLWQLLLKSAEWRLVYTDETALVFVRADSAVKAAANPSVNILDHALLQATSFTVRFPDTAFHWLNLAEIYLLRNQHALAVSALRTALAKKPGDPEISNRLFLVERGIY